METKLLCSLLEAYFSLVTKNNRGLRSKHNHLHRAVATVDTLSVQVNSPDNENKMIDFICKNQKYVI